MDKRFEQIDSLRGLASLTVMFSHLLLMYHSMESYTFGNTNMKIVNILKYSPLHLFWAGHEAVILFFILSGFVLSLPFYKKRYEYTFIEYKSYIVKRICRIYIPYICAVFIAFIACSLFSKNGIQGMSDFFNRIWTTPFSLELALQHVFLIGDYNTRAYNPAIWSLVHEMRISLIFPFIMILVVKYNYKINIAISLFVSMVAYVFYALLKPEYMTSIIYTMHYASMFVIGALLAKNIGNITNVFNRFSKSTRIFIFLIGVLTYTYSWLFSNILFLHKMIFNDWMIAIGSCIFIITSLSSEKATAFLTKKSMLFLGKTSYSLYLYHIVPLFSFGYLFHNILPLWLILVLSAITSVGIAYIGYRYIEIPSISLGRRLSSSQFETHRKEKYGQIKRSSNL